METFSASKSRFTIAGAIGGRFLCSAATNGPMKSSVSGYKFRRDLISAFHRRGTTQLSPKISPGVMSTMPLNLELAEIPASRDIVAAPRRNSSTKRSPLSKYRVRKETNPACLCVAGTRRSVNELNRRKSDRSGSRFRSENTEDCVIPL